MDSRQIIGIAVLVLMVLVMFVGLKGPEKIKDKLSKKQL